MAIRHILGFPRLGKNRELKFALESHWRGATTAAELEVTARRLRADHWALQRAAGLDYVSVGDFALYDHVLNHIQLLGCEPARFGFALDAPEIERYFIMARGRAGRDAAACGCGDHSGAALEMTKWFDTNYHYLVPEFDADTQFRLAGERLFDEIAEAQALGHHVKAQLIGPLSFLWLGKSHGMERLELLDRLLAVYRAILSRIRGMGVEWVQIDEPILGQDLPPAWRTAFEPAYHHLAAAGTSLLLATYFSPLRENLTLACRLPVAGLHIDAVRAPEELAQAADWLPLNKVLSAGVIDGRNVWTSDLDRLLGNVAPLKAKRGDKLWISASCSLLHVPLDLGAETALGEDIKSLLAFGLQKLDEISTLAHALDGTAAPHLPAAPAANGRRQDPAVQERLARLAPEADRRASPYALRQVLQQARLKLPPLPTTTIGSFPQTADIRRARAAHKAGTLDDAGYRQAMREEIRHAVAEQEALGLDVLVHGEAERNDMVEYFAEQLQGFAVTRNGWVQSYGSRCVKPPIIWSDVARPAPMAVEWASYAQSLTRKPVKGMLTGPVTMLQWSFVRDDQPRAITGLQIALAIRDEVADLQRAGIAVIQIDEPALREGLPLRRSEWNEYLDWAVRAFRIAAGAADDATQIHTHMCYAEFNDILPAIAALDADVITIEASRSNMELLQGFARFSYPNAIGPGVYDIHTPRVPESAEMVAALEKAAGVIAPAQLWVNPDCGLKTRSWEETRAALAHMVEATHALRAKLAPQTEEEAQPARGR